MMAHGSVEALERRQKRSSLAVLLLVCVVLGVFWMTVGIRLGDAPITRSTELRCFEVAQHMVETGDRVVPMRAGIPWINKPPLGYWAIAAAASLRGQLDLVTLRLPSLLAAVALLAVTGLWARAATGPRTALVAMVLLGITPKLQGLARTGSAEVLLALAATAALAAYGSRSMPSTWRRVTFVVAFALAILAKATMAVLLVALPITIDLIVSRRLLSAVSLRNLALVAVSVLPGVAWYRAVMVRVPGAFDQLVGAATLPLGVKTDAAQSAHWATHYGLPHEQLVNLAVIAFPTSLLLPLLVRRAVTTRLWRHVSELRFAAIVCLTVVPALMLLPQKRPHYLLPVLPALSLLTAEASVAFSRDHGRTPEALRRLLAVATGVIGMVATAAAMIWVGPVLGKYMLAFCVVLTSGTLMTACAVMALLKRDDRVFGAACVVGWTLMMALNWGHVDLWRRAHQTGTTAQLNGFDAERWAVTTERFPGLFHSFELDEKWAVQHISNTNLKELSAR